MKLKDKHEFREWEIDNDNIVEMECTCSACPTQFEGKLSSGEYFYFRERHDYMRFTIDRTADDAVWHKNPLFHIECDGWTKPSDAAKIIDHCVNTYIKTKEMVNHG